MHLDALHVADAPQIDARHHGLSPESLPFSCAEIVPALQAVDECLVSSCEVLVVRGMFNAMRHPWSTFSMVCSTVFEVKSAHKAFAKMRVVSWIATGPSYMSHVAPSSRL